MRYNTVLEQNIAAFLIFILICANLSGSVFTEKSGASTYDEIYNLKDSILYKKANTTYDQLLGNTGRGRQYDITQISVNIHYKLLSNFQNIITIHSRHFNSSNMRSISPIQMLSTSTGYNISSAPSAPVNLTATKQYQNSSKFHITWANPPNTIIVKAYYKLDTAPRNNSDYSAFVTGTNVSELVINVTPGAHIIYVWLENNFAKSSFLNNASCKFVYENTAPTAGNVIINNGSEYAISKILHLRFFGFKDKYGIKGYYYSVSQTRTEQFYFTNSTNVTVTVSDDGTYVATVMAQNYANINSTAVYSFIIVDTTPPKGSLIIDHGAHYTNSTTLTLQIKAIAGTSPIALMRINTVSDLSNTSWIAYSPYYNYTVSPIAEQVTVYIQLQAKSGLVSKTFNSSILLDLAPPYHTLLIIDNNAKFTASTNFKLQIFGEDNVSGISTMRISIYPNFTHASWIKYQHFYTYHNANIIAGVITIYVQLRDVVNNTTPTFYSQIIYMPVPPSGSISVKANSINNISYVNTTHITLILNSSAGTIPITQMRISNFANMNYSTGWITYKKTYLWNLTAGDGPKTVYAQFKTIYDNSSAIVSAHIYVVSKIYEFNVFIPPGYLGSDYYNVTKLLITGNYTDPAPVWIYINSTRVFIHNHSFKYYCTLSPGNNTMIIKIVDAAGNTLTFTKRLFVLLTCPHVSVQIVTNVEYNNTPVIYSSKHIVIISGTVNSTLFFTLNINNHSVSLNSNNHFLYMLSLNAGVQYIKITVFDKAGNHIILWKKVKLITTTPTIVMTNVTGSNILTYRIMPSYMPVNITWYVNGKLVKTDSLTLTLRDAYHAHTVTVIISDPLGSVSKTWVIPSTTSAINTWLVSITIFIIIILAYLYVRERKHMIEILHKMDAIDKTGIPEETLTTIIEVITANNGDLKSRIAITALQHGINMIMFDRALKLLETEKIIKLEKDENAEERVYKL